MRPGHIINAKKITGIAGKSTFDFKSKKGATMVFVFLGVDVDGSFDTEKALNSIGWFAKSEPNLPTNPDELPATKK